MASSKISLVIIDKLKTRKYKNIVTQINRAYKRKKITRIGMVMGMVQEGKNKFQVQTNTKPIHFSYDEIGQAWSDQVDLT